MRSLRIFFSAQRFQYGGIAQLGERLNGIQEVSGSIPLISTISRERAFITRRIYAAGFFMPQS